MAGQPPEYLQPRVRIDGPIRLAEPDPGWRAVFARQEERIRGALGARAIRVEHVGSTSVPGLAARPVIDIALTVVDSSAEADYVPDLEAAGFVLQFREPHWYEHRFLRARDPAVQVHVFTEGSEEVERMLLFRNVLRRRPDERALYERTKRDLARHTWAYGQDYADAKSGVVQGILARALAEVDSTRGGSSP